MLLALALLPAAFQEYDALTNNQVEVTNFNPEPFTGLTVDSAGNLWAVNPYGNTVIRHNAAKLVDPASASPSAAPRCRANSREASLRSAPTTR